MTAAPARRPRRARRRAGGPGPPRAGSDSGLDLRLPPPPVPTARYVPAVAAGRLLFVSGQDPERAARLVYRGRVGREVTPAAARSAVGLLRRAFGSAAAPLVLLRPARGLAGGMPVGVELLLELRASPARR